MSFFSCGTEYNKYIEQVNNDLLQNDMKIQSFIKREAQFVSTTENIVNKKHKEKSCNVNAMISLNTSTLESVRLQIFGYNLCSCNVKESNSSVLKIKKKFL